MKIFERTSVAAFTALWLILGATVSAQEQGNQTPGQEQAAQDVFPQDQIEQLVAPIALYPDALLAQVLMASTYPLDVVQAARWRRDNPDLKEEALEAAAAEEPWDQSVKTLLFFPDVLSYMNENLDWTQDLGDAVLAQQDDVTEAVQVLRREAKAAGNLETTEQQKVEVEPPTEGAVVAKAGDETIIIQPADPQVVYVPSYNPSTVYGQTTPPATTYYPEAYTNPTTSYVSDSDSSSSDSLVSFGVGALAGGLLTAAIMWDDDDDRYDRVYYGGPGHYGGSGYWNSPNYWDGGYRRPGDINIDRNVNIERGDINIDREVKKWEHNPERRGGVRYRNKETENKFANVKKDRIDRDTARGRDPNRKRPEVGGKDRPQVGDRDRPGKGDLKRPATREAKRPETRDIKRPDSRPAKPAAKKDIKRPETRQAKAAPQKRDVKINKPKGEIRKPAARPAAKPAQRPAAAKASRPVKRSSGSSGAFKPQKGGQARAASNRGAKSRGSSGGRAGGGGRGGGGRRR
jgi:hypothetical protein